MMAYRCNCPPGFDGMRCENDIDECSSSPCSNGGTCEDEINGYQCICTDRYEGKWNYYPFSYLIIRLAIFTIVTNLFHSMF